MFCQEKNSDVNTVGEHKWAKQNTQSQPAVEESHTTQGKNHHSGHQAEQGNNAPVRTGLQQKD